LVTSKLGGALKKSCSFIFSMAIILLASWDWLDRSWVNFDLAPYRAVLAYRQRDRISPRRYCCSQDRRARAVAGHPAFIDATHLDDRFGD
jgi:hypothetical protein